jgi:hypothetical protein
MTVLPPELVVLPPLPTVVPPLGTGPPALLPADSFVFAGEEHPTTCGTSAQAAAQISKEVRSQALIKFSSVGLSFNAPHLNLAPLFVTEEAFFRNNSPIFRPGLPH